MKAISLLITLVFLFSLTAGVLAQETELPDPGLTPDSPFYFLEIIAEEIGTFFTFGDLKKAERYANLAAERLAEAQVMVEREKPKLVEKTLERYEDQLEKALARAEKADAQGKDTKELAKTITEATYKHLIVLNKVLEKVPEEAKPAIERAMIVSAKGHAKAVEVLKEKDALSEVSKGASLPTEIPQDVREILQREVQEELEREKAERTKEAGTQSFEVLKAICLESGAPVEMCTSIVERLQSSVSLRAFCAETGGPPEMCEKIPVDGFKSFEQIEAYCIEIRTSADLCGTIGAKCREMGVTTADECFLVISTAQVTSSSARSLSEEEMEELRIQREAERAEAALRKKAAEERIEELRRQGEDVPVGPPEN